MRVSTPQSEAEAAAAVTALQHAGWKKLIRKKPKPSRTGFRVVSRHLWHEKFPVTRLALTPHTGRTHQLRVHCAALGHPIVGDQAYGVYGEAAPNGGFDEDIMNELSQNRASLELQLQINDLVKEIQQKMCLHATNINFKHPSTQEKVIIEAPPPF